MRNNYFFFIHSVFISRIVRYSPAYLIAKAITDFLQSKYGRTITDTNTGPGSGRPPFVQPVMQASKL